MQMASASGSESEAKLLLLSQSTSDVADREFVLKIISLYRDNPVLWDITNQHYANRYRRIAALKKICDNLKSYKPNYTVEALKKKLNILRTNFNKERNKIDLRKSMSTDSKPEANLWYYNEMSFLLGKPIPAQNTAKNIEPTPTKIFRNLEKRKISIVSDLTSATKQSDNEEEILAKCWAMKLRKLTPEQKLFAEKIINDTLFEAELGTLTRHGATFNAAPIVWTRYSTESPSPVYKSHQ